MVGALDYVVVWLWLLCYFVPWLCYARLHVCAAVLGPAPSPSTNS